MQTSSLVVEGTQSENRSGCCTPSYELMYLILVCAHAGDFSLRGISSTAFDGVVYGVAPHNRCSHPGTDDGKVAYGYLARPEPLQSVHSLLCFNTGSSMEWRAVGGSAPLGGASGM